MRTFSLLCVASLVANAACMAEGVLHSLEIKGPLILTHGAVVHNYNGRANLPQRMAQIVFDDGNTYVLLLIFVYFLVVVANCG